MTRAPKKMSRQSAARRRNFKLRHYRPMMVFFVVSVQSFS